MRTDMGGGFIVLRGIAFFSMIVFCYLMLDVILTYLLPPFPGNIDFFATKQDAIHMTHWLPLFYIHIISGFATMVLGVTQFSKWIMENNPNRHKRMGKAYVALVLLLAAPSGFILAFSANGGALGQAAFTVQSLVWWMSTILAFSAIRNKNFRMHCKWMIRSYALTLSAVSLRAMIYFFGEIEFPLHEEEIYIFSAWASWIVNVLLAEILIRNGIIDYYVEELV